MYILQFRKNKSKYFEKALTFAEELNCEYDGHIVIITVPEESLYLAYSMFRQLFGLIQNWKDTTATFRGKKVHPYKFILEAYNIYKCSLIKNCKDSYGNKAWGCHKINAILYHITGSGNFKKEKVFWYNYGHFINNKWIIDKPNLLEVLLKTVNKKGLDLCPLYDENNIRFAVNNLPSSIIPDNKTFKIHYIERYVDGVKLHIKKNIRHISNERVKSNGRLSIPLVTSTNQNLLN